MDNGLKGRLNGRRAIVTGAGSGIGAAVAARLQADEASVFTVDLLGNVDRIADVTEAGINSALVKEAAEQMGGIDIVVPCAGVTGFMPLENHEDAFLERIFEVNVYAVLRLIRDVLPYLKQSPAGRIVTIGSTTSRFGDEGLTAYGASKHAVLGMTRSIAAEVGKFGITANCLQPGAIETPMTEPAFAQMPEFRTFWENKAALGRLGQPEDIADVIAFLCSDDARFMSGQGFFVDGGAMQRH